MSKKTKKIKKIKFPSELRMDLVSGDWVVIATGRAKKPGAFRKESRSDQKFGKQERADCPFCKINKQETAVIVISNKFPAFLPYPKLNVRFEGKLYKRMNAVGFHELVITRDHKKHLA